MAYLSQNQKKTLAPGIKAVFAKYGMKGTVAVRHHSTLVLNVSEGPLDLIGNANAKAEERCEPGERRRVWNNYVDVNEYYARDQFSGACQVFVLALLDACNVGNWNRNDIQADHFDVGWYVNIHIGRWDKPYRVFEAACAPAAATGECPPTKEGDYGGAFDGVVVTSDADPGL
jgi:hypothetical protein